MKSTPRPAFQGICPFNRAAAHPARRHSCRSIPQSDVEDSQTMLPAAKGEFRLAPHQRGMKSMTKSWKPASCRRWSHLRRGARHASHASPKCLGPLKRTRLTRRERLSSASYTPPLSRLNCWLLRLRRELLKLTDHRLSRFVQEFRHPQGTPLFQASRLGSAQCQQGHSRFGHRLRTTAIHKKNMASTGT